MYQPPDIPVMVNTAQEQERQEHPSGSVASGSQGPPVLKLTLQKDSQKLIDLAAMSPDEHRLDRIGTVDRFVQNQQLRNSGSEANVVDLEHPDVGTIKIIHYMGDQVMEDTTWTLSLQI